MLLALIQMMMIRKCFGSCVLVICLASPVQAQQQLRAGAASADISPRALPAIRNGGFIEARWHRVDDPLHARCLVVNDGSETLAIAIVDSCMLPTDICDDIKARVAGKTTLASNRILISATHTHSAPSVMSYCLGSGRDEAYVDFVVPRVAEAIILAYQRMQPAKIGWASLDAPEQTNCRRWITRSDRIGTDPFGDATVRAMMHPGYLNPAYVSPAGPIDPQLSILSVVAAQDESPLCVLANYSMHYFGSSNGFSADYFGEVAVALENRIEALTGKPSNGFVGIMSQGTSGDLHWMDYSATQRRLDRKDYAKSITDKVLESWKQIEHRSDVTIAMAESRMKLRRRAPNAERLQWAKSLNEKRGARPPKDRPEVYAQQAEWIDENRETDVVLQAVRIGDVGITALPNEVYGITGLKLKRQSPLHTTFNLELANGAEGYIPPPEQHRLGGYTTWPARTAGLEVNAEPKIVQRILSLLETVSGKSRRPIEDPPNAYSNAVTKAMPVAYWRLGDMVIDRAADARGTFDAAYRGGVALHLPGPTFSSSGVDVGTGSGNRSVYFAGGTLEATVDALSKRDSVSFWFWNGLPASSTEVVGTLMTRGKKVRESLSIVGTGDGFASLAIIRDSTRHVASTPLATKAWHHVTMVRKDDNLTLYLDGNSQPELSVELADAPSLANFVFGDFDGKLDDIAVFDRAISVEEIVDLYAASQMKPPKRPERPVVRNEKPSDDDSLADYAESIRASAPIAYWRLHEGDGRVARDYVGEHDARYESGAAPRSPGTTKPNFFGGRVLADVAKLGNRYSIEFWFCNQLPNAARPVTGYMLTRGVDSASGAPGDSLGIGGTHTSTGRLLVFNGNQRGESVRGKTLLAPGSWNHVVMTRDDLRVQVFLNGQPEMAGDLVKTYPDGCSTFQIGGRNDHFANFQGMIDEVAVYDRLLTPAEIESHFVAAGAEVIDAAESESPKLSDEPEPVPTSSEASLERIHIRDGYEVQLVASEPQVQDPVAIDWGLDGKLWVVEMADYPLGIDGKGKPGGRIRFLEDQDGDGYYETSKLFADGLSFPNGILVWRKGVLVTAAPQIVYLEDTDGDGKADLRRPLFSGFLEGNQQLRVNGLRYGLDNWVHCASGSHHSGYGKGNRITSLQTGQSHQIGSRDFRVRPDTGAIDPQSGPSQYGRNRDDWGNWFGVQNSRPLWHYVLRDEDIRRNPHFAPPDPKRQVVTPVNPPVYAAAPLQKRFHNFDQSGRFTSACSAMIYRDDILFPRSGTEQHAFTCEPFHNLVQHNVITEDGVSFRFHRDPAEKELDFFASEDRWCRPVMVRTGPDGGLWIVDMYRYMIEHPQWLPQIGKDELRPYYRLGEKKGRIYRVVPNSAKPIVKVPRVSESTDSFLQTLASSNGWQRDAAQRVLVSRRDLAAVPKLALMAESAESATQRLHALCTLDGMQALTGEMLATALADSHAGVRRHAVRLAASYGVGVDRLASLIDDPNAKVRLELAAALGEFDGPDAARLLVDIAVGSLNDDYIVANVMSSLHAKNISAVLDAYIEKSAEAKHGRQHQRKLHAHFFGQVAALGDAPAIGQVVDRICDDGGNGIMPWQMNGLADLLDGLARRRSEGIHLTKRQQDSIDRVMRDARKLVSTSSGVLTPQIAASLRLMLRQPASIDGDIRLLRDRLVPQSTVEMQLAIVDRLESRTGSNIAEVLLSGWTSYGPILRSRVLDVLASRTAWSRALLSQVRSQRVSRGEISPEMRERLLATKDKSLHADWAKEFSLSVTPDRKQLIQQYQSALTLTGDRDRGMEVFKKTCSACHRMGNIGHEVGPNLLSISDKRPQSILSNVLDPSAAVEARYLTYIALTSDGRIHNGLLATETGSSITLVSGEGKRVKILRSEIEDLRTSGKSLMPDGMEKDLSPQAIADLITLLRSKPSGSER